MVTPMKRRWSVEIKKLIFTHLVLIGIPTIFLYWIRLGGWSWNLFYMATTTFYLVSTLTLIVESTAALFRRFATNDYKIAPRRFDRWWDATKVWLGVGGSRTARPWQPMPRCSFLVAAYLPNEQDIILETLTHILDQVQRPDAGLEVILAYNTPSDLPVEDELHKMAKRHPELHLLRVEGSCSKAENLNAAVEIATGEIACILDADHHPASDGFVRAWHWLAQGYAVVQGRNVIRNYTQNLLTQMIAIEFETLYGISHAAKSFLTDSSIFGGSNGYWRTSVLRQIRFNSAMLTEDVDVSMRTLSNGYRIVHDRSIIASELAPVDWLSFWFQRKRWIQGWLEVSLKYQGCIWEIPTFTRWQKLYWMCLLYYCKLFPFIAIQILPILLSLMLYRGYVYLPNAPYLYFITCFGLLSGIYRTIVTAKIASYQYPIFEYVKHVILLLPFLILKNAIAIVALYDHMHGTNNWWITPRSKQTPPCQSLSRKTLMSKIRTSSWLDSRPKF